MNSFDMPQARFTALKEKVVAASARDPLPTGVRVNMLTDAPQLKVNLDEGKLAVLGLTETAVTATPSAAWGSTYIDDFIDRGIVERVYMQADAPCRMLPDQLDNRYVRSPARRPAAARHRRGERLRLVGRSTASAPTRSSRSARCTASG